MKTKSLFLSIVFVCGALWGCGGKESSYAKNESEHEHHEEPVNFGPHGGRLFEQNGFGVEVTIYEPEIPPQSRVYVYDNGKSISPTLVTLVTELHRIDKVDTIRYQPQDDYLLGDAIISEPHSFDVKLQAEYQGKTYSWSYSSYEGRTTLSEQAIKSGGIETEKAGPAPISTAITLNGRVVVDELRVSRITARFPGVVKEIRKFAGDKVDRGDVIATVEANESLKTYDLVSPRSGEVLDIGAATGEVVGANPIVTVGDLSSVWVELSVPRTDFSRLKVGQKVLIYSDLKSVLPGESTIPLEGKITYLSSLADGDSQTRLARAEVTNTSRVLIPELFVEAKVLVQERVVPVAVKTEALQTFRNWDVVFKKSNQTFEAAIVELGEVNSDWVEVKSGILPGTEYVTKNSFVVKADVMKSGAAHSH